VTVPLLLLALQAVGWAVSPARPTVGDTVRITRQVPALPSVGVRLEPLTASRGLQPLAPPRWSYAEERVAITYLLAMFEPGPQTVSIPAVELVYPDGRAEVLPATDVRLEVASVLPADEPSVPPKASLGPVPRARRVALPVIVLPTLAVVLVALAAWWSRRRDPRPTIPPAPATERPVPIDEWVAAGESRAVATVVALRLRQIITETVSDPRARMDLEACVQALQASDRGAPARELVDVLRALERARFSPAAPADIHEVVDDAERAIRAYRAARTATGDTG
jgi:hypothetical protein